VFSPKFFYFFVYAATAAGLRSCASQEGRSSAVQRDEAKRNRVCSAYDVVGREESIYVLFRLFLFLEVCGDSRRLAKLCFARSAWLIMLSPFLDNPFHNH